MRQLLLATVLAGGLSAPAFAADTILWIDDANGNIGQVDINTQSVVAGSVHNTGLGANLTDIAFGTNGTMYGTTYTNLYSINTGTGAATQIGSAYPVALGGGAMVALVGSGTAGNLLGADNNSTGVFNISQTTAAVSGTKNSTDPASGDLAFAGPTLYESALSNGIGSANELVNISNGTTVGLFHVGSTAGPTIADVFGLADDGSTMYAVQGTEVYSVDLANAVLTPLFDYSLAENNQALTTANGSAFIGEGSVTPPPGVPEPGSLGLLGVGLLGLVGLRRRR